MTFRETVGRVPPRGVRTRSAEFGSQRGCAKTVREMWFAHVMARPVGSPGWARGLQSRSTEVRPDVANPHLPRHGHTLKHRLHHFPHADPFDLNLGPEDQSMSEDR